MIQAYDVGKFKAFICYKECSGNLYAELLRDVLASIGLISFVAHIERENYSEVFDDVREQIIPNADYFFFINTEGVSSSSEVIKEFNIAYGGKLKEKPKLVILRPKGTSPSPSSEFESKIGIKIGEISQATFFDEDNLIDVIGNLIRTYNISEKIPPKEQFKKKLKLIEYLKHCISLTKRKNPLDDKTLDEMYIQNNGILIGTDKWEYDDNKLPFENEAWNFEDFLKSDLKYVVVGSPYGVGKTSFSYEIASNIASKAMKNISHEIIPIHVSLKYKFNVIDSKGNTLDNILSLIPSKDAKILFLFDGLDEYEDIDKIPEIYEKMTEYLAQYQRSKVMLTTRLISGYPKLLNIENYVRLRPFTKGQVDEFFKKYGLPLTYNEISESGLESDEITKPLFCWMIALIYSDLKTIKISSEIRLNRTLLFSTLIHSIVFGKHKSSAVQFGHDQYNLNEKLVLRKIAELKHIYQDGLTKKHVLDWIMKFGNEINKDIIDKFETLISSYFYNYEERLEFIHKSLVEYLVAEYYIACYLSAQPYRINLKIPSKVTIEFFQGLLSLINSEDVNSSEYTKIIIQSYEIGLNSEKMKSKLLDTALKFFNDDGVHLNDKEEYMQMEDDYENISHHRWLSIMIINTLGKMHKIDSKKLFKLFASSHGSTPDYLISIDNIDLSGSTFDFETPVPNWNLSKAKLSGSNFHGRFSGTEFSGADMSNCTFEQSTTFVDCKFSGANMSGIKNKVESAYAVSFIRSDFNNCNLKYAHISSADFTYSNFRHADLSNASFSSSNFSVCDLSEVTVNENTTMKGIELLSRAGTEAYRWWMHVRKFKDFINFILFDMDSGLKEIILRDNQRLRDNN